MNHEAFKANFNGLKSNQRAGYEITDYITQGGQAWVFGADHADGPAAIKVFKQFHDPDAIDNFKEEGRRLKELSASDYIATVKWLDSAPVKLGRKSGATFLEYPYMVMERAQSSVKEHIGAPDFTTDQAIAWLTQAMEGIRYAHGELSTNTAPTVHRDIKPANILVINGRAAVTDFGIAVSGHNSDRTISKTQLPMGTLPYMAPEQFHGRAVRRSDVYSMGVTGYQLLTGLLPINAHGDYHTWYLAHQQDNVHITEVYKPDGTPDYLAMAAQEVMLGALKKDPRKRYGSMGEFQDTLIETAAHTKEQAAKNIRHFPLLGVQHQPDVSGQPKNAEEATVALPPEQTQEYRTQLLAATYQPTKELPEEKQQEEPKPETRVQAMGRRAFSGLLVGAGTLFIEEIVRRGFFVPEAPVKPEVLSANEQVVKAATKVIDLCKQRGQTSDVFHLVRNLIPVDAKAAYEYIKDLPVEQKSWLAADLAQYDPANAEKIMVTYEQSHDYTSAARIAIALSYYCKEHLSDASSKYVSGVPVDPVKKAAYTAAVRVANTCNDADIQDMIDIAGSISYRYSNFGKPVDKAQQKVEALRTAGKHVFVEMFCRVIARDNSSTVADCIRYYQDQITKRTGDQQAKMLQMARDLAIDIAPFSPETAVATMQAFDTQKASSDFSAAADAIAVAVAPYELSAVSKYIVEDAFTHKNRMPLGIAIVRRMPGMYHTLRGEMTGPYLPWYEFAYDPTSEKAQKALDALNDANFKDSAYWATVTALKSQTSEQK